MFVFNARILILSAHRSSSSFPADAVLMPPRHRSAGRGGCRGAGIARERGDSN